MFSAASPSSATRISVELILSLLAQGVTQEELLEDYPRLEADDIRACIAYAHAVVAGDSLATPSTTATSTPPCTPPPNTAATGYWKKPEDDNIISQLRRVADLPQGGEIEFVNGDTINLSVDLARVVLSVFDRMKTHAQIKFQGKIAVSKAAFEKEIRGVAKALRAGALQAKMT